ncbi:MAG: ester cyclase [Rhodanobacteraceae bacterium]|nr:ester cyclase [Rhodanobacteraceae bacterium]
MNEATRVMHEWFERVWNQGDEGAIHELMPAHALFHGLPSGDASGPSGPAGFIPYFRMFRTAVPDLHVEILRTVAEGERVAVHCRVTGTHTGPGLSERISGARVCFEGMVFGDVREGQIHEGWNLFDSMALNSQISAGPG